MKPSFAIPAAQIAIMERSLFGLFGAVDDGSMLRVRLPATAWWDLPAATITERIGRRRSPRQRRQRERCLAWLFQQRGIAA
jgi:hypothetical protein